MSELNLGIVDRRPWYAIEISVSRDGSPWCAIATGKWIPETEYFNIERLPGQDAEFAAIPINELRDGVDFSANQDGGYSQADAGNATYRMEFEIVRQK